MYNAGVLKVSKPLLKLYKYPSEKVLITDPKVSLIITEDICMETTIFLNTR